jgi:hypothetical protein
MPFFQKGIVKAAKNWKLKIALAAGAAAGAVTYDGIVKEQGPASFLESEDAQVTPPFKTKT